MKKKVVLLWMAAMAMLMSCQEKDGNQDNVVKSFETMTVSKQDITLEQSYPAQIEGRQSVKIIPRVEGYLRQICVKEGQRVKKGQVLFVIEQASYQSEVKAAAAERAYEVSKDVMQNSSSTYLEVLTAQQALLQSYLSLSTDHFDLAQGKINLFKALGGTIQ